MKRYIELVHIRDAIKELEHKLFSSNEGIKKQKGTYYTPHFIVEWMVNVTVMNYLFEDDYKIGRENFLDQKRITTFFEEKITTPQKAYEVLDKLSKIKICDISMGWGIFLLYAFELLYHLTLQCVKSLENSKYSHPLLYESSEQQEQRIINHIISKNLYGVDLSPIAIQLAELKLYEYVLRYMKTNTAQVAHPNFIVGNSLIGTLSADDYSSMKHLFNSDIQNWLSKIPQVHWSKLFPKVFASGGFDIVVGNPPYINVKKLPIELSRYCHKIYKTYNSNGDIANVFIERAIQLTRDRGFVSLITPRYWIEGHNSNKLRRFLLKNSTILSIIDFRDNRTVFQQSEGRLGVDTLIITCQKVESSSNIFDVFLSNSNLKISAINDKIFTKYKVHQSLLNEKKWIFHITPIIKHLDNIREYNLANYSNFPHYDDVCNVGKGCSTGNNAIFTLKKISANTYKGYQGKLLKLKKNEKEALKLLIKGKDIRRFIFNSENRYWIFLKDKSIEQFPTIENYMKNFYEKLTYTQKKYNTKNYYDYVAYRSLELINQKPKIITPYQSETNRFAIIEKTDPETIYESDVITLVLKTKFLNTIPWNYLLAVLNSAVIFYYIAFKPSHFPC